MRARSHVHGKGCAVDLLILVLGTLECGWRAGRRLCAAGAPPGPLARIWQVPHPGVRIVIDEMSSYRSALLDG